jgi:hypothetical protein
VLEVQTRNAEKQFAAGDALNRFTRALVRAIWAVVIVSAALVLVTAIPLTRELLARCR